MDNEEQQAVIPEPTEVEDSPRPESPEPSVADSVREAVEEQTVDTDSDTSLPEDQKGGDDTERKSRAEKRVGSLVEKLKAVGQQGQPEIYGEEPLFTPEEIESGQFDPGAVQSRMQQNMARNAQLVEQQVMQRLEFNNSVNEHLADIDKVQAELGDDPDLDSLVTKQYDALNHQVDPRTGMKVFVPTVKMSEIYQEFKQALDKKTASATAEVQAKVNAQADDQAVPVSVTNSPSTDVESQAAFTKAAQTGSIEDWAAVLKRRNK